MMLYFHIYSTFYVCKNLIERHTREKIMVVMPIYNFLYVLVPRENHNIYYSYHDVSGEKGI
jgi:hypothetical protein